MWFVNLALRHRYTVGALILLLLFVGVRSLQRMPTDILPAIDTPYVNVLWTYPGLPAEDMAAKIASFSEIAIMNNVDGVKMVSSESGNGYALIQVQFHPSADLGMSISQITSVSQTILKRLPAGMTPPLIVNYTTSSVPIIQLAISSDAMSQSQLYDYARLTLRRQIQSIPGLRLSLPYGGSSRQLMVNLDPARMINAGVSAKEIAQAIAMQNITLPSGELKVDDQSLTISTNASPSDTDAFFELPVKSKDGTVVRLGDVASIVDGGAVQTSLSRLDGKPGVMVSILKLGNASTVDIVREVKRRLPQIQSQAPEGLRIISVFDQSRFVTAARDAVLMEALLVAGLVAAVVLLFLGSYRSTLIVLTSIPLALLVSLTGLHAAGYTLNLMTLGGLGLAIGILVDNALVEIENINRNRQMGKPIRQAVLDSASQVMFPEFVSTLSICIVLLPIFALEGASAYIFRPLAMAVLLAMLASFILSRTWIPTLAYILLRNEKITDSATTSKLHRLHLVMENKLHYLINQQVSFAGRLMRHRKTVILCTIIILTFLAITSLKFLGRDYFPESDAGGIRIHARAEPGSNLEETARQFEKIHTIIKRVIPEAELKAVAETIGPPDPINRTWIPSMITTQSEGEILVQLQSPHDPTKYYIRELRKIFSSEFPNMDIMFRPADIIAQTLNGTADAAIEVSVSGRDIKNNLLLIEEMMRDFREVPGAVDVMLGQVSVWPDIFLNIDRVRAEQLGVDIKTISQALLVSLSSSATVFPNNWANQGISYTVAAQILPEQLNTVEKLLNIPVAYHTQSSSPLLLRNVVNIEMRNRPAAINREMLAPVVKVLVNVDRSDLGSVYDSIQKISQNYDERLSPGNTLSINGQAKDMVNAYSNLAFGMLTAAAFVYLLMVTNFQSWLLPFAALGTIPAALIGSLMALWATATPLSVSAFMGMIMVMGVTTANSVLLVSFARHAILNGRNAHVAAREAIAVRMKPITMTAMAMFVGMIPMALAMGEGAEQNAPLARAVMGGLILGTPATLTLVPLLISFRRRSLFVDEKESLNVLS